ncbi:resolvase [Almyronema epifaneia]|uniref:Resolvase n=1 Tax=Almyronema epifaneia S1 TaxID=2991925 RepID=A0ABW6I9S9_9CYAN
MLPAETNLRQPVILGFDPGRDKCGIAIMGVDRILRHREVLAAPVALERIQALQQIFPISTIVLGDQTTAKTWRQQLVALPNSPRVIMVDERNSSLEARDRYWQIHPPKGLQRLLPHGLRTPPGPIDDIVAILLIERYLNRLTR